MNRRGFLFGAAALSSIALVSCGGGGEVAMAQPATAVHRPLWVGFAGDSITSLVTSRRELNFPEYALRSIDYRMSRVGDFGISGDTTRQVANRHAEITAAHVDVLVVMAGHNNGFETSLLPEWQLMWRWFRGAMPNTTMVACTILPSRTERTPIQRANFEEINAYIKTLDGSDGGRRLVADTAAGFDWVTMTRDGIHPNALGAEYAGRIVGQVLGRILTWYPPCRP